MFEFACLICVGHFVGDFLKFERAFLCRYEVYAFADEKQLCFFDFVLVKRYGAYISRAICNARYFAFGYALAVARFCQNIKCEQLAHVRLGCGNRNFRACAQIQSFVRLESYAACLDVSESNGFAALRFTSFERKQSVCGFSALRYENPCDFFTAKTHLVKFACDHTLTRNIQYFFENRLAVKPCVVCRAASAKYNFVGVFQRFENAVVQPLRYLFESP